MSYYNYLMNFDDENEAVIHALVFAIADLKELASNQDVRTFFLTRFYAQCDELREKVSGTRDGSFDEFHEVLGVLIHDHLAAHPEIHNPVHRSMN